MLNRLLPSIMVILTLNACATTAKYEAKLAAQIGNNEQQLISAWGQPNQIKELKNGNKILIYTNVSNEVIPITEYYNTDMMTEDDIFYPFTYGGDVIPDGNFLDETITDYCQTKFYLKNNIVTSWKYKGNACVAI